MHIVVCHGDASSYNMPGGATVRSLRQSRGLAYCGVEVTLLFVGKDAPIMMDEKIQNISFTTSPSIFNGLKRINQYKKIDVIIYKYPCNCLSWTLEEFAKIRSNFKNAHISAEFMPWIFDKQTRDKKFESFDKKYYQMLDSVIHLSNSIKECFDYWMINDYKLELKPNIVVPPSFDARLSKTKNSKTYTIAMFDSISKSRNSLESCLAIERLSSAGDFSAIMGISHCKDKKLRSEIINRFKNNSKIKMVEAGINNIDEFYSNSLCSVALFNQTGGCTDVGDRQIYTNIRINNRIVESIGNMCTPIIYENESNKEIFGEYRSQLEISHSTNISNNIYNKIMDIVNNKDRYAKILENIDVGRYSNIKLAQKMIEFYSNK